MAKPLHEWSGSVATIPGRLSFTGRLGNAAEHSHAAVQIVQVQRGHIELHADGQVTRVTAAAAIPTATPHRLVAGADAWGTITYLDPGRISEAPGIQLDPSVIDEWLGEPVAAAALHPVVRRALDRSREQVGGSLLLRDLAADLDVSSSRLGHLFAEQLGMTFPAWRRWVRLEQALVEVISGATLTDAAHAAGFADSAHLTRSCRDMFGITPSEAAAAVASA